MKRFITFIVVFFIFCSFSTGIGSAEAESKAGTEAASIGTTGGAIQWPATSAEAAIVLDGRTGRVLYEKNAQMKEYMASTTKIMTALLALEAVKDEEEMVKISETAASQEGSAIYMEPGERVSFRDLIYALMLRSGNDAAVALAERVAGSEEQFAELMNQRAKEMGALRTHFVTASGLHDDNHYTTAYDLGLIAFEAMKNPRFREIVATPEWNASREVDKMNYFYNKNKVLHQYEGGTGIKIGYTKTAGRCLVASSQRDGIELICVVLSAGDWFNDTYKLMDTVYANYEAVQVAQAGVPLKTINVENGTKGYTKLVAKENTIIPLTAAEKESLQVQYRADQSQKAPISRGTALGEMDVFIGGEKVGAVDLVSREDISASVKGGSPNHRNGGSWDDQNDPKGFFSNLLKAVTNRK